MSNNTIHFSNHPDAGFAINISAADVVAGFHDFVLVPLVGQNGWLDIAKIVETSGTAQPIHIYDRLTPTNPNTIAISSLPEEGKLYTFTPGASPDTEDVDRDFSSRIVVDFAGDPVAPSLMVVIERGAEYVATGYFSGHCF